MIERVLASAGRLSGCSLCSKISISLSSSFLRRISFSATGDREEACGCRGWEEGCADRLTDLRDQIEVPVLVLRLDTLRSISFLSMS